MITVLVTGVGGGGVGRQVIKALRQNPSYRIIGTDMTKVSMGLYEVDKPYIVPSAKDPKYVESLLDICEKEQATVLIPGSEPELQVISQNRQTFLEKGVTPLINTEKCISTCMDKWDTYGFLRFHGFNTPYSCLGRYHTPQVPSEMLPVVIKPTTSSGGSLNVYIAQDMDEVEFFTRYLRKQGLTPMVQQYVGSYDAEYTVGVLTDFDGSLIGSIAVKRQILSGLSNRTRLLTREKKMLVISSGISQGEVGDFPIVCGECEKIALALHSKGPLNLQCRTDGDKVYVFEINPRFSGTTYVRALVGYNEPDILIRKLMGETGITVSYKKGMVVRGLEEKYIGS
jgi:carbamoyl-phosphate synthase large subunit